MTNPLDKPDPELISFYDAGYDLKYRRLKAKYGHEEAMRRLNASPIIRICRWMKSNWIFLWSVTVLCNFVVIGCLSYALSDGISDAMRREVYIFSVIPCLLGLLFFGYGAKALISEMQGR